MKISFDYYKVFYYVAKYNNISIASDKLNMSQPNVSRCIKKLEEEIGMILFVRSNKGVLLTEKGNQLYNELKSSIEIIEEVESNLADPKQESGRINIGLSEISIREHFMPIMKNYLEKHPKIRLSLTVYYSNAQALNALKNGNVDMIIISKEEENLPSNINQIKLIETHFEVVCGGNYRELLNKIVTLNELSNYPLISLKRGTGYFSIMEKFYLEHGLELNPDIEIASFDQSNGMIMGNIGVAILPEDFAYIADFKRNNYYRVNLRENLPMCWTCYLRRTDILMPSYFKDLEDMIKNYKDYKDIGKEYRIYQ